MVLAAMMQSWLWGYQEDMQYETLLDFSGKVVLVTGGSRGIGATVAEAFAAHGANIVINSVGGNIEGPLNTISRLKSYGVEARWIQGDVSKEETGKILVDNTVKEFGRLDTLVHCAGITDDDLIARMTGERWKRVIETNLSSGFYVGQAAVRQMQRQREGSLVFISSISAHGNPGQASYAASKAGIEGLMRTFAVEYMNLKRPIRANAIACGLVNTDMANKLNVEQREAILKLMPLGRMIEPEEVANVALFLASPMASAINGTIIDVDGGMLRR